jgi:hypothetical protein
VAVSGESVRTHQDPIPDVGVLLALAPEELAPILLQLARERGVRTMESLFRIRSPIATTILPTDRPNFGRRLRLLSAKRGNGFAAIYLSFLTAG